MRLSKLALLAAIACGIHTVNAEEQMSVYRTALNGSNSLSGQVVPVGFCGGCEQPSCGSESCCEEPCDSCDACDSCGGDSLCSSLFAGLGEGGELSDMVHGWVQLGYHSQSAGFRFNDYADGVRLHQAYLYAEKVADGSDGVGIGGRIDYVYGIDAPDTQAFGQDNGWDADWDHGRYYGHALPQAYTELAYGDTSVKIGHFYTLIGYEVVTAPGNFFYSHSYTMFNCEPFTHTGVLATHKVSDDVSLFGGYVLGWDSGFEDNGDAFLGGASWKMGENISTIYSTIVGRFNETTNMAQPNGVNFNERGYMHSLITTVTLTDKLSYVFWTDYLNSDDAAGAAVRDTLDFNQYLLYTINDQWAAGARAEWWNVAGDSQALNTNLVNKNGNADIYVLTLGLNYKPSSNLIIRPEVRWDWDKDQLGVNENGRTAYTTFGIDGILSF